MASCQYFETDKISSDTFYDQEIKTISWNQVDQYPNFVSCQKDSEKKESKACFENTLVSKIYAGLSSKHFVSTRSIKDTLWVSLTISEKGTIFLDTIAMDSLTAASFPELPKVLTAYPLWHQLIKEASQLQLLLACPLSYKQSKLCSF
jgi:hypothetical protein